MNRSLSFDVERTDATGSARVHAADSNPVAVTKDTGTISSSCCLSTATDDICIRTDVADAGTSTEDFSTDATLRPDENAYEWPLGNLMYVKSAFHDVHGKIKRELLACMADADTYSVRLASVHRKCERCVGNYELFRQELDRDLDGLLREVAAAAD
jgi:hypothetical protein